MAKNKNNRKLAEAAVESGRYSELISRLLFLFMGLIVYRIGTFVPVPGIDPVQLAQFFEQQQGTILSMVNMFSGGALERLSVMALGIMPYISASIIMQLLTVMVPSLEQLKKEGEAGRRKITQYTRYFAFVLALFQSIGVMIALDGQGVDLGHVAGQRNIGFLFTGSVALVTGTMFLMWLGEQITERGIGNGISMIIFAGIVAGLPRAIGGTIELARTGELSSGLVLFILLMTLLVTAFVIFVERGQRRITINYAKQTRGNKLYQSQSSHLPLKLNMAGVIPSIFASSIILFPATLGQWFGRAEGFGWMQNIANAMAPGQPLYILLYALAIVFFCFFYTALQFNARDTADNLKRSGAFIPGIRPGDQTAKYVDGVLTKLTAIGAIYITAICLLPEFLILKWNVPFYFGGTSLLIIVVVIMDFITQVQARLMSTQYEGLLKKANLKGHGRSGGVVR